jgi:membrane-bound metal-dependent hydrolase YbcI (DUF457 family)
MKIPEHVAFSFLLAQFAVQQEYGPWGTGLMILAGCLPDLDGLTIIAGWQFYRKYHRIVGHGLPLTIGGPLLLAALASFVFQLGPLVPIWFWLQVSLLSHLLIDIWFYRWPVLLLWPVSRRGWGVGLLEWNDLVPTLTLYTAGAVALVWPTVAMVAAIAGITSVLGYLVWRAYRREPRTGWGAWLAGGWAEEAAPVWRWLTGDFIS